MTINTDGGVFTVYSDDDVIGKQIFCGLSYENILTSAVIDFLNSCKNEQKYLGETFLDIGANMGISSISMVKENFFKRAIAIEPDPKNYFLLQENVIQNNLSKSFACLPVAVTDTECVVELTRNLANYGDTRITKVSSKSGSKNKIINVKADSIDNLLLRSVDSKFSSNISLVWIDVQGHEGYIFKGGPKLFTKNVPVVSEIWPYGIKKSGIKIDEYLSLVKKYWKNYFTLKNKNWTKHSIMDFPVFLSSINDPLKYENIIFYNN